MPRKPRKISKARKLSVRSARRRRTVHGNSGPQRFAVHRRLVVYPKDASSSWLDQLAWYGSIALKLFKLVSNVTDEFKAVSLTASAGAAIVLGPNDFCAVCPAAAKVYTSSDAEIQALRVVPFSRSSLPHLSVKIVPAVDTSVRGGMYAALLIPFDEIASATSHSVGIERYVPDYDQIIKHPRAILSPSTRTISLRLSTNRPPHNICPIWEENVGYLNCYATYVLLVAYSSMASDLRSVNAEYNPTRALFEIHLTGSLNLYDASAIPDVSDKPVSSSGASYCTRKVAVTNGTKANVRFFDKAWDVDDDELDLFAINSEDAKTILKYYKRDDLLERYDEERLARMVVAMDN